MEFGLHTGRNITGPAVVSRKFNTEPAGEDHGLDTATDTGR